MEQSEPQQDQNPITALIIDDDEGARSTFGKILKHKGYTVDGAASSSEALAKAKEKFFNIFFVDVRLPDKSGIDLIEELQGISKDAIIIMVTGYASIDSAIDAMNRGAFSYMTKPINMEQAFAIINKALEKQFLSIENKRLLKEMQAANKKLLELDERKSIFVSNVAHELKTPLATVNLSLENILERIPGEADSEQKRMFEIGKRNIERLLRLVTDLLDLAKIEKGKLELKREEIDLEALTNEVTTTYELECKKKHIIIKKEFPDKAGFIWADKDKITEVITNLLNNAIKYSPQGSNIIIKIDSDADEARFAISDNGPGIPVDAYDKVFSKFERITAEKEEGSGLGLPIAKDIIGLHKGKIWVDSEMGKGSTFTFALPRDLRKQRDE